MRTAPFAKGTDSAPLCTTDSRLACIPKRRDGGTVRRVRWMIRALID